VVYSDVFKNIQYAKLYKVINKIKQRETQKNAKTDKGGVTELLT